MTRTPTVGPRPDTTLIGGLVAVLLAVTLLTASPAGADCAGPTVEYATGPADPGETFEVTGFAFGDNCYDTGDPPAGEGVLGRPLTGVEVVVQQEGNEWIVATGDADGDYEFVVQAPVPPDADPGEATVVVRIANGFEPWDRTASPLEIGDGPTVDPPPTLPVAFEPGAPPLGEEPVAVDPEEGLAPGSAVDPLDAGSSDADDGSSPWLVPGLVAAGALVVLGLAVIASGRREPESGSP